MLTREGGKVRFATYLTYVSNSYSNLSSINFILYCYLEQTLTSKPSCSRFRSVHLIAIAFKKRIKTTGFLAYLAVIMDNVQDEILALLREMQGDDHKRDLAELEGYPGVPYRQPTYNSNGHEQQLRQPQASTSHIYSQQSLYQSQPTRQLDHFLRAQQRDHPDAERWYLMIHLCLVNSPTGRISAAKKTTSTIYPRRRLLRSECASASLGISHSEGYFITKLPALQLLKSRQMYIPLGVFKILKVRHSITLQ